MIRLLFLFLLFQFIIISNDIYAQAESSQSSKPTTNQTDQLNKNKFSWDKVYMGGGLGLQFGTITQYLLLYFQIS